MRTATFGRASDALLDLADELESVGADHKRVRTMIDGLACMEADLEFGSRRRAVRLPMALLTPLAGLLIALVAVGLMTIPGHHASATTSLPSASPTTTLPKIRTRNTPPVVPPVSSGAAAGCG